MKNKIKTIIQNAKNGDVQAQIDLAVCYGLGQGVKKNLCKAFKWNLAAPMQGNPKAQCIIGIIMYWIRDGVKQSFIKANPWYMKAAEQGNADTQYNLGQMYMNGQGGKQDYKQALF